MLKLILIHKYVNYTVDKIDVLTYIANLNHLYIRLGIKFIVGGEARLAPTK